jgi:hypothetical protein
MWVVAFVAWFSHRNVGFVDNNTIGAGCDSRLVGHGNGAGNASNSGA